MSRPVETLSEALGFVETVLEVGHSHPAVRRVLAAAGSTASFLVSLDDERISDPQSPRRNMSRFVGR